MRLFKLFTPLLFCLTFLAVNPHALFSQSRCQPVSGFGQVENLLDSVNHYYGAQVITPIQEINAFVKNQIIPHPLNVNISAPVPYIANRNSSSITFQWTPPILGQNVNFQVSALNLSTPNRINLHPRTSNPGATFTFNSHEAADLWMYTFYTIVNGSQSALNIIIIDKDISFRCPLDPESVFRLQNSAQEKPSISPKISPNPFYQQVNIHFDLPTEGVVAIELYDLAGKLIARPLANTTLHAGQHQLSFDWADIPPGSYLCKSIWNEQQHSQLLIKARE